MTATGDVITFVSHTNKPGGGELALRRYLEATALSVRLVTLAPDGVWAGMAAPVESVRGFIGLRKSLADGGLVVANSMRAAFLCALVLPRRAQLVYWVRDGLTDSAMSRLALALTRHVTARRTSHFIANSDWTARTIANATSGKPAKINVVHSMCGVTDKMLELPPPEHPHVPLRLLFMGRISPWKAPDVAVRAVSRLRQLDIEATLTIAGAAHFGEAEYEKQLRALVDTEPTVSMVGHIDDVPGLLTNHDILVHCSTAPEPFGQVIVQALAMGMPVVATDHGGPVEILRTGPEFLRYRPGDPDELARCIASIVPMYADIGRWGKRRAALYSDSATARRGDQILRDLTTPIPP